jgi:predicted alpha/beta-hydrolase family hydrolase
MAGARDTAGARGPAALGYPGRMAAVCELRRLAVGSHGEVSALACRPDAARWLLLLAHGAGAGMRHPFLEGLCERFAARGVASLRFQFPYMEAGRRTPDRRPALLATLRAALTEAAKEAQGLPLVVGGKSMGGRIASLAAAESPLPGVRGLVFFGFPLHPARRPAAERGRHLERVALPLLFLQGTRDALADLALLRPLCEGLGPRATLHVLEGADHSFHLPKRSGRSDADALDELAAVSDAWASGLVD